MPTHTGEPIACPNCGSSIVLPLQARLRAAIDGTGIACPECGGTWLLWLAPKSVFTPLATPKRRRGPKRYHPPEE